MIKNVYGQAVQFQQVSANLWRFEMIAVGQDGANGVEGVDGIQELSGVELVVGLRALT